VVDPERGGVAEQRHHRGLVPREAVEPPLLEPLNLLRPERSPLRRFLDGQLALQAEGCQRRALLGRNGL